MHKHLFNFTYLTVLLMVSSCTSERPAPKPTRLTGEFTSHIYRINDSETVTVFTVPDKFLGKQCIVYANEKTGASHMECEDNLGGE